MLHPDHRQRRLRRLSRPVLEPGPVKRMRELRRTVVGSPLVGLRDRPDPQPRPKCADYRGEEPGVKPRFAPAGVAGSISRHWRRAAGTGKV